MPKLTILDKEGKLLKERDVPQGTRLVNAIKQAGVDIFHLCGSYAKCTTCRIKFIAGEPEKITQAEQIIVGKRINNGDTELEQDHIRLSCQIVVDQDMTFQVLKRVSASTMDSPGPVPEENITPDPVWLYP